MVEFDWATDGLLLNIFLVLNKLFILKWLISKYLGSISHSRFLLLQPFLSWKVAVSSCPSAFVRQSRAQWLQAPLVQQYFICLAFHFLGLPEASLVIGWYIGCCARAICCNIICCISASFCCINCIVISDAIVSLLALDVAAVNGDGVATWCSGSSGGGDEGSTSCDKKACWSSA